MHFSVTFIVRAPVRGFRFVIQMVDRSRIEYYIPEGKEPLVSKVVVLDVTAAIKLQVSDRSM